MNHCLLKPNKMSRLDDELLPSKSWAYWGNPAARSQSHASFASISETKRKCLLQIKTKMWKLDAEKQTTEPQYKCNILGQTGATANSKRSRQLCGKTNEPVGHVLQQTVCRLQRRWWQAEEADCWHLSNNAIRVGCCLRPQWDVFFDTRVSRQTLGFTLTERIYNCV